MKRVIIITVIFALLPCLAFSGRKDVVATIEGEEIGRVEYGKWLFKNANTTMLLENYISTLLFRKKAKELGIEVPAEDIERVLDERVAEIIEGWKSNEENYLSTIEGRGLTHEEFAQEIRENNAREVTSDLYASRIIFQSRKITDYEIKSRYYKKYGRYGRKYKVRHILKSIRSKTIYAGKPNYEYSLKKAEEVALEKIRMIKALLEKEGPENFALIAETETEDMITKYTGGQIGVFNKNRYKGEFSEIVPTLKVGEISDILKSDTGYHIVKVNSINGKDIDISHIMAAFNPKYVKDFVLWNEEKEKFTGQLEALKRKIEKGADFEKLAGEESDDYSSIYGSDMSARLRSYETEFLDVLKDCKEGDLKIIESEQGVHLVLVEKIEYTEYTDELKEEIRNSINQGVAETRDIVDLAKKLLIEARAYYKM